MFWGVTILGGRRYTQTVERSYHISKAVLEIPLDSNPAKKRVQVMLEQNKSHFLLCNLDSDKNVQVDLDLIFTEGEEVTFYLKGEGSVHLTGYVLDFDDGEDFDFDEEDEELEDEEDATNDNAKRVNADSSSATKKAKVDVKVNGIADDDEDDDDENILGTLDEDMDSDEDDEEDDEEDEEDDEEDEEIAIQQKPKPVQKPVNGQTQKPQQQQKGTPAKGAQNQNQNKNLASAGKQNNQGGQQNKFGQKGQNNSPQGQKQANQNQKGGQQQQKGQLNQNKQQFNKGKGSFTPDTKDGKKTLQGGLQVEDVHVGHGPEARKGKFVHVRYVGRLANNKEFDRSANKPFSFVLGAGSVIKGWDLGLAGMKVGGKRKIVVPPNMGYGSRTMGPIPANSQLHFEVELVSVS